MITRNSTTQKPSPNFFIYKRDFMRIIHPVFGLLLLLIMASHNVFGQTQGQDCVEPLSVTLGPDNTSVIDLSSLPTNPQDACVGESNDPPQTVDGCGRFTFTNIPQPVAGDCPIQVCFFPSQGCGKAEGNLCVYDDDGNLIGRDGETICVEIADGGDYSVVVCRPGMGPVSINDIEITYPPSIDLGDDRTICETDLPATIDLTAFEPTGQTGGTWTSPDVTIVDPTQVIIDATHQLGDEITFTYCHTTMIGPDGNQFSCEVCDDIIYTITDDCCVPGVGECRLQGHTVQGCDPPPFITDPNLIFENIESCGDPVSVVGSDGEPGACINGVISLDRTYTVYINQDGVEGFDPLADLLLGTCIQPIHLEIPATTIQCPEDDEVACFDDINAGTATVTTSCGIGHGPVMITGPTLASGDENCPDAMYEIEYSVTDDCGRKVSCTQTFTISNTGPVIACPTLPNGGIVACANDIVLPEVTWSGSCGQGGTIDPPTAVIEGDENCPGTTYTYTYNVTDACGRDAAPCVLVYTIANDGPVIVCPDQTEYTVECASEIDAPTLTWSGSCDQGGTIDPPTPVVIGEADCDGTTYTYTYEVTDECGRDAEVCVLVYTIKNSGPVIDCPVETSIEVACSDEIDAPTLTWSGSCDQGGTIDPPTPVIEGDGDCSNTTYTYTYEVTDACGRAATACVLIYTVVNDGPDIACPAETMIEVECASEINPPTLTWSGSCDQGGTIDPPTPVIIGEADCDGTTYTYTYEVTDECGRDAEVCVLVYTIKNSGPVIACPVETSIEVACSDEIDAPTLTWSGSCGQGGTIDPPTPVIIGEADCDGTTYTYTYEVTDECGRDAEVCVLVYTIKNSGPVIACPLETSIEVTCSDEIDAPTLTWSGSCGQGGTIDPPTPVVVGEADCDGTTYTYTYEVTDECGRDTEVCVLVYTIKNSGPVIDCPVETSIEVACSDEIDAPTLTWSGSCGQGGTIDPPTPVVVGEADCDGTTYTYTYEVTDECGRDAEVCVLVYTIKNSGPVIDCPVETSIEVACSDEIDAPTLTWSGSCGQGGTIDPPTPVVVGEADCDGTTYTYTYEVTDECGRDAEVCVLVYTIKNSGPVIACPVETSLEVACSDEIDAPTLTWSGSCGQGGTIDPPTPVIVGEADCDGTTYTYTYEVTDECGRDAVPCVLVYTIKNAGPVIDCPDQTEYTVECSSEINAPTLTWSGSCGQGGEILAPEPAVAGEADCDGTTYTYTYEVTDECGRDAVPCVLVYTIKNSGPVIDCPDQTEYTVECSSEINAPTLSWSGSCGQGGEILAPEPAVVGEADCDGTTYTYTYEVTDECGRDATTCVLVYTIKNAGPVIDCPDQTNYTVECADDINPPATLAWTGSCGQRGDVAPTGPVVDGDPNCNGTTYTYTYSVTDKCGRDAKCVLVYTIDHPELVVKCPDPVELKPCCTEKQITDKYEEWIAGFKYEGGCNAQVISGDIPALPEFECYKGYTLEYTYIVKDDCHPDGVKCSSYFKVEPGKELVVKCPDPAVLKPCCTEKQIADKYAEWIAGFIYEDGCNAEVISGDIPALPAFECYAGFKLEHTFVVKDDCHPDGVRCTSYFEVEPGKELVVKCPDPAVLKPCCTEKQIADKYAEWIAGFKYYDGCNAEVISGAIPDLPEFDCYAGFKLEHTYVVKDDCHPDGVRCTSYFEVEPGKELVVKCPDPAVLKPCCTEKQIADKYAEWIAGFKYYDGCNAEVISGAIPSLPAFECYAGFKLEHTYVVKDDCHPDGVRCTSYFEVEPGKELVVKCPDPAVLKPCCTEKQIADKYAEWIAGFKYYDGCNAEVISGAIPSLPAFECYAGFKLEHTYVVKDDCHPDGVRCTSYFEVEPGKELVVKCPDPAVLKPCCTEKQIADKYAEWIAGFKYYDGCNAEVISGAIPSLPTFECYAGFKLEHTFIVKDDCHPDGVKCSSYFEVEPGEELMVSCPGDMVLKPCCTETQIAEKYALWVAGFAVKGGCNTSSNMADIPKLPAFVCGGPVNLEFTLVAYDDCNPAGKKCGPSKFVVEPADEVKVECPDDMVLKACCTKEQIETKYAMWVAGFKASGGCDYTTNIGDIPALPAFICGAPVNLEFTFIVKSDCDPGGMTCTSKFVVEEAEKLDVVCSPDMTLKACCTEQQILDKFAIWRSRFDVKGGCNASSNISQLPLTPFGPGGFVCGAAINIEFTLTATDDCNTAGVSCTSKFVVEAADELSVACPDPEVLKPCCTEMQIATKYKMWVDAFKKYGGCNAKDNISEIPALPAFECGKGFELAFTYHAYDDCNPSGKTCSSTFTVEGSGPPMFDHLPGDLVVECNAPVPPAAVLTASSKCPDDPIVVKFEESRTDYTCSEDELIKYQLIRTWTATDFCGREISHSQIITVQRCCEIGNCETAFARSSSGATCFDKDGFNRWGWTNGPFQEGDYTMEIYQGASHCDISNRAAIGELTVSYHNGVVDVEYEMYGNHIMNETHLYVGCDPYPVMKNGKKTVAPGQYTESNSLHEASSDKYSIAVSGCESIYVIAHAVTCAKICDCDPGTGPGCKLTGEMSVTDASVCEASDGSASVSISDASGVVSYQWNTGGTTAKISDLKAGHYSVTATDQLGCVFEGSVEVKDPECSQPGGGCETAYARAGNGRCFDMDGFSRWGWTNKISRTEVADYSWSIFAGAGQCNISKGAHVGNLIVTNNGSILTIQYDIFDGFEITEAHLYIGCDKYPTGANGKPTVANGQYPYQPAVTTGGTAPVVMDVSNFSCDDLYVIAHAVTCGGDSEKGSAEGADEEIEVVVKPSKKSKSKGKGKGKSITAPDVQTSGFNVEKVSIYPNPASNHVNLQLSSETPSGVSRVRLFDALGKFIKEYRLDAEPGMNVRLDLPNSVQNGMYYFIIQNEDQLQTVPVMVSKSIHTRSY